MKKQILFFSALFAGLFLHAQRFDGIIDFTITEGTTSEKATWYVKGDSVRIDYFTGNSSMISSCLLINTKHNTCTRLDHNAKTREELIPTLSQASDVVVDTTSNEKIFFKYNTKETIVKPDDRTELHYWTTVDNFPFYRNALYWVAFENAFHDNFWYLPDKLTTMTMLATQVDASGKETARLEVTRLEKRALDANLFAAPANYKKI